jgi:Antp family protein
MTSYFSNSYIPDLRNGSTPEHYQTCTTPVNGNSADPNMHSHYQPPPHQHHNGQGQPIYPRFPPYDRLDIRAPPNYYGGQGGEQILGNQGYRPPSPPPSVNPGIPMGGHVNVPMQPTTQGYTSCKMQQQAPPPPHQVSPGGGVMGVPTKWEPQGPPLSPDVMGAHNMNGGGAMTPNGHSNHNHMGIYNHSGPGGMGGGGPPPPHPHQHMVGQTPNGGPNPLGQGGISQPHPNHQNQNPHQSPQQQNSPAAALPSPLYPWMRSQFGKSLHIFFYHNS